MLRMRKELSANRIAMTQNARSAGFGRAEAYGFARRMRPISRWSSCAMELSAERGATSATCRRARSGASGILSHARLLRSTYVFVLTICARHRERRVLPIVFVIGALSQFPTPAAGNRGENAAAKARRRRLPSTICCGGPSRRLRLEGTGGGAHAAVPPPIWLG